MYQYYGCTVILLNYYAFKHKFLHNTSQELSVTTL